MHILALVTLLLSITGHPTGDQKDGSRYYFVEGSRSPKGTYVLAFEIEGHKKVDWSRLMWGHNNQAIDYLADVLNTDDRHIECFVYRRKDMVRVQKIQNLSFWPIEHYDWLRKVAWTQQEDAFVYVMTGYWSTATIEIINVKQRNPLDSVELLIPIKQRLDAHMRKSYPDHLVYRGYPYAFDVMKVEFLTSNRLVITLHSYVPKGAGDWEEDIKLRLRVVKAGKSLIAKVEKLQQISLTRERERD